MPSWPTCLFYCWGTQLAPSGNVRGHTLPELLSATLHVGPPYSISRFLVPLSQAQGWYLSGAGKQQLNNSHKKSKKKVDSFLLAPMAALHYNYNFILSLYSFNLTLGDSPKANDAFAFICLMLKCIQNL